MCLTGLDIGVNSATWISQLFLDGLNQSLRVDEKRFSSTGLDLLLILDLVSVTISAVVSSAGASAFAAA